MKANRKFVEGEEAVSAVIGVILMVAITVAIAAAVYVYVSGMIGGTTQHTPSISCTVDNANDKIVVASAESGLDWKDIKLIASGTGLTNVSVYQNNGQRINYDADDYVLDPVTSTSTPVGAADYINVTKGTADVQIQLVYIPTNTILGTWTIS